MTSRFLNLLTQVVVCVKIKDIRHKVECILIIWHFTVKTRKIKPVSEVFLVNLAEIFIASGGDKLQETYTLASYSSTKPLACASRTQNVPNPSNNLCNPNQSRY